MPMLYIYDYSSTNLTQSILFTDRDYLSVRACISNFTHSFLCYGFLTQDIFSRWFSPFQHGCVLTSHSLIYIVLLTHAVNLLLV